jgi:hypothetical protein
MGKKKNKGIHRWKESELRISGFFISVEREGMFGEKTL